jgi:hypothetical protein
VTGSYLTPDPLGLAPAPNPHAYVPNPLIQTDPLGLMSCGPQGGATQDSADPRSLGTDLPRRIYSARALIRMADGDTYHNFPESFNQTVFDFGVRSTVAKYFTKPASLLSNDSINYTLSGSINGVDGEYQIFTRPSVSRRVEVIMHRFFMPH